MIPYRRRRLLIDIKVQGALCLRLLVYWVSFVASLCLTVFVWQVFADPLVLLQTTTREMAAHFLPVIAGSCLLVPVLLYDCIALSNRFAGPIHRLRNELRKLADGQSVAPIHFRQGDFWCEMADEFNGVAARIEQLESRLAEYEKIDRAGSTFDERWPEPTAAVGAS